MASSQKKGHKKLSQQTLQAESLFKRVDERRRVPVYEGKTYRSSGKIYESDSHLDADEIFVRLKKKGNQHIKGNRLSYTRPAL